MCQLGILGRPAIHLAAANRLVLSLSQFVDSLDTSTFERVRMDSARWDSSNQVRCGAICLALNLGPVPDRDETIVLKLRMPN
jgi:hypothetical protein